MYYINETRITKKKYNLYKSEHKQERTKVYAAFIDGDFAVIKNTWEV